MTAKMQKRALKPPSKRATSSHIKGALVRKIERFSEKSTVSVIFMI
jgi:hypothetical protein